MGYFIEWQNGTVWGPIAPDNPTMDYDDLSVGKKVGRWVDRENKLAGGCVCLMVVSAL